MFPFGTPLNAQFFSDLYASSAFYVQPYYFLPEEQQVSWTPLQPEENGLQAILASFTEAAQVDKQEATRAAQKPTRNRERDSRESSVSSGGLDESEEVSPEVRMRQKYGRNINSNIFQHMLKRIGSEEEYQKIMAKIIARGKVQMSLEEFKQLLGKKISRLPSYISLTKMRNAFKGSGGKHRGSESSLSKERDFCLMLRTVCCHYLNNQHVLHIFNGLRIKKESRKFHVMGCRKVIELLK